MQRFSRSSFRASAAKTSRSLTAATFAGFMMTWATPAAAQGNCGGIAGIRHRVAPYDFVYLSRSLAQGANGRAINCVRNNDPSRSVYIDWRGTQLMGFVKPRDQIFTSPPLGHTPSGVVHPLYYGPRPLRLDVATMVDWDSQSLGPTGPPLLLRASLQEHFDGPEGPITVPGEMPVGRSEVEVFIPVGTAELNQFLATNPSRSALIEWLEVHPAALQRMAMTFDSRSAPSGANLAVTYELRFRLPAFAAPPGQPTLYLRFSDPTLHNQLFRRPGPMPIARSDGSETVLSASATVPRARIAGRRARLEVLLRNGALIAALPVTYVVAG